MIEEMNGRSAQVASWLASLTADNAVLPEAVQAGAFTACGWLRSAAKVARSVAKTTPMSERISARELLRGFPVAQAGSTCRTSSCGDERARFHNYADAPPDRIELLRDVYRVIVSTSRATVTALDSLALDTGAPSKILALARQAISAGTEVGVPGDAIDLASLAARVKSFARPKRFRLSPADKAAIQVTADPLEDKPPAVRVTAPPDRAQTERAPFESRVRALIPDDPSLALRAAAIDRSGNDLVNQVLGRARADDLTSSPARLAAIDRYTTQSLIHRWRSRRPV